MVESAPRFALLRTGETAPYANTTECLGYGDGGNGRSRQLQQRENLAKRKLAPHKTRYKTTSPWRKLLNLKGEWKAMREGRLTAIPSVRAQSCGPCYCKKKVIFFLAG